MSSESGQILDSSDFLSDSSNEEKKRIRYAEEEEENEERERRRQAEEEEEYLEWERQRQAEEETSSRERRRRTREQMEAKERRGEGTIQEEKKQAPQPRSREIPLPLPDINLDDIIPYPRLNVVIPSFNRERKLPEFSYGIPCPEDTTIPSIEAKEITLPCTICSVNQIQTVNFPCMHACFCIECVKPALNHANTCPQCRIELMHIALLYLPYKDTEPSSKKIKSG